MSRLRLHTSRTIHRTTPIQPMKTADVKEERIRQEEIAVEVEIVETVAGVEVAAVRIGEEGEQKIEAQAGREAPGGVVTDSYTDSYTK